MKKKVSAALLPSEKRKTRSLELISGHTREDPKNRPPVHQNAPQSSSLSQQQKKRRRGGFVFKGWEDAGRRRWSVCPEGVFYFLGEAHGGSSSKSVHFRKAKGAEDLTKEEEEEGRRKREKKRAISTLPTNVMSPKETGLGQHRRRDQEAIPHSRRKRGKEELPGEKEGRACCSGEGGRSRRFPRKRKEAKSRKKVTRCCRGGAPASLEKSGRRIPKNNSILFRGGIAVRASKKGVGVFIKGKIAPVAAAREKKG